MLFYTHQQPVLLRWRADGTAQQPFRKGPYPQSGRSPVLLRWRADGTAQQPFRKGPYPQSGRSPVLLRWRADGTALMVKTIKLRVI